ncbi:LytTR family DNA-binding domain-containing protein [Tenacibaculum sp. 190524A02b]|uniref:LytR/AlgR family response regulator transcription factor n=1 Tax=Tenacibaculum vairaonense TaxID=3137860 RepID=UPI0031FACF02
MNDKITCIIVDDEPIAREILTTFIGKIPNLLLLQSCSNAMEALTVLNDTAIDLLFLDINMPEVSGLSLAKSLQKKTKIIFTTAYRDYAVDGFDLNVVDYLLKPIAFDRFLQAVNKFYEISNTKETSVEVEGQLSKPDFIFVRSERKMQKVNFKDIVYVESLSDYVKIHTQQKTIVIRETISNIENKLPNNSFLRIHRSYIVSLQFISFYTNEFVEVNNKSLPISRGYKEDIISKLSHFS